VHHDGGLTTTLNGLLSQATSQAVEQLYYIYNRISDYVKKTEVEVFGYDERDVHGTFGQSLYALLPR
jgi:hypothetical protein